MKNVIDSKLFNKIIKSILFRNLIYEINLSI